MGSSGYYLSKTMSGRPGAAMKASFPASLLLADMAEGPSRSLDRCKYNNNAGVTPFVCA